MKKLHRTALVAGMLAFGVAACGDDVTVVEPTPPPPPPLSVTLSPSNASVGVGEVADFAVGVSGGDAGATASWTCASSNTSVATVATTDTGCRATGVAAGSASVTATVTKGNQSSNAGAQLTVAAAADTNAQVSIQSISHAGGSSLTGIAGQLDVRINLTPNDETVTRLELVMIEDGEETVVAAQEFAAAAFAEQEEDAAENTQEIVLSFNTARYEIDEEAGVGVPDFINGDKQLSARAFTVQAGDAAPSAVNTITVEFDNEDFFDIMTEVDGSSALSSTGVRWHEGDVTVMAYPVFYSGKEAAQVQIALHDFDDADPVTALITDAVVLEEGPYTVTFLRDEDEDDEDAFIIDPFEGRMVASAILFSYDDGSTPDFSALGVEGLSISGTTRFDIVGPTFGDLDNALRQENRWVGENWAFFGGNLTSAGSDTITYVDDGVGKPADATVTIYVVTDPDDEDTWVEVETGADAEETSDVEGYWVAFRTEDRLGNVTTRWASRDANVNPTGWLPEGRATATGRVPPATSGPTPDHRIGVDLTPPELEYIAPSFPADSATENFATISYTYQTVEAGPSGLRDVNPFQRRGLRDAPGISGADRCLFSALVSGNCTFSVWTGGSFFQTGTAIEAYYTTQVRAIDNAGNIGEAITRVGLFDETPPQVVSIIQPSTWTATSQASAQFFDNLDLKEGFVGFVYGGLTASLPVNLGGLESLGEFGPDAFTQNATIARAPTLLRLTGDAGATWTEITNVVARVFDFNEVDNGAATLPAARTGTLANAPDDNPFDGYSNLAMVSSEAAICSVQTGPPASACTNPTSTALTVTLDGPGAAGDPLPNPFSQVVFLYRVDGGADDFPDWRVAGTVSSASINLTDREITFTNFNFAAAADLDTAGEYQFVAVGVNGTEGYIFGPLSVDIVNP